jgi:hypothetical protein
MVQQGEASAWPSGGLLLASGAREAAQRKNCNAAVQISKDVQDSSRAKDRSLGSPVEGDKVQLGARRSSPRSNTHLWSHAETDTWDVTVALRPDARLAGGHDAVLVDRILEGLGEAELDLIVGAVSRGYLVHQRDVCAVLAPACIRTEEEISDRSL